jgi:hypothetical protein
VTTFEWAVEICVTEEPPPNLAIISWLGTDAIQGTAPQARALRSRPGGSTSWAGTPHMHLAGTRIRVVLDRAAGGEEFVQDEPFSFENQRGDSQNVTLLRHHRHTWRPRFFQASTRRAASSRVDACGAGEHGSCIKARASCIRRLAPSIVGQRPLELPARRRPAGVGLVGSPSPSAPRTARGPTAEPSRIRTLHASTVDVAAIALVE